MKLTRNEIRHSNMLAWLLNPNENHQLGSAFSKYFFHEVYTEITTNSDVKFDFSKLFLESADNFMVNRERSDIDLLLVAERQVICIENKIDSLTHSKQLTKYETIVNRDFPHHEKLFLYLTPNDEEISDYTNWHRISYLPVSNALQKILETTPLKPTTEILLKDYYTIIKGEIMHEDDEIEKLCLEIYKKYKPVLDLIYQYRPDENTTTCQAIIEHLKSREAPRHDIIYPDYNYGTTIIRFTTETMTKLFPNSTKDKKDPWSKGYAFMYEIHLNSGEFRMVFFNPHFADYQQATANKHAQNTQIVFRHTQISNREFGIQKRQKLRDNWQYFTAYQQTMVNKDNCTDTKALIDEYKKQIDQFINIYIPEFEKSIKNLLTAAE